MEEIWTTNTGSWTKPPQGLILWTWQTALATALYFHFMHCLTLISLISNPLITTLVYDDSIALDYHLHMALLSSLLDHFCHLSTPISLLSLKPHLLGWPLTLNELNHSFFFLVSTSSRVRSTKINHTTMWDAVIHQRSMLIDTTNTIQCTPGFCKLSN